MIPREMYLLLVRGQARTGYNPDRREDEIPTEGFLESNLPHPGDEDWKEEFCKYGEEEKLT